MRWKHELPPQPGQTRTRRVFAWRRERVGDYVVWLESFQVLERCIETRDGRPRWVEVARDVLEYVD